MTGTAGSLLSGELPGEASQYGSLLASGFANVSERRVAFNSGVTSGTVVWTYTRAPISLLAGNLRMITGTTAAAATPTLCKMGLYSVAANGDLTLMSDTANDTALFAATNTSYTKALVSASQVVKGLWYATAILVVSGVAVPTFQASGGTVAGAGTLFAVAPRLAGSLAGQVDLPASVAAGAVALNQTWFHAAVLP